MIKVELRMNEQIKYKTIKELVDYNGNKNLVSLMSKKRGSYQILGVILSYFIS